MIIREAPVDNAWYRAAGTWFIALSGINCLVWPVFDFYRYDLSHLGWVALSIPLGSATLWISGKFFGKPTRVLLFVTVIGLFGVIPLLLGLLLPIIVLLFLPTRGSLFTWASLALLLMFSTYWIQIRIKLLHEKIATERFIEREFRIGNDCIYLNRSPKTDLDAVRMYRGSRPNNISAIFPLLFFLLAVGYPLQRFLFNSAGIPGVVFLLSILETPLAIHIAGRTACGFYLWIYTVRKLEIKHGKPVVFEPDEAAKVQ